MNEAKIAPIDWLRAHVAREIPLSGAMQLAIEHWDGRALEVAAPLAPNRNHKATAFGGSLYSVAVMACWGLLVLRLRDEGFDCEIVIQHAEASYFLPVADRISARCEFSDEKKWQALVSVLRRRGRGRIELEAEIVSGQDLAFQLRGRFVAHLHKQRRSAS